MDLIVLNFLVIRHKNYKLVHGKDDFEKVKILAIYGIGKSENINLEMLSSFIYTDKTKNEIDLFKNFGNISASIVIQRNINW